MSQTSFPASTALVLIDIQNDFCPGGALAVAGGDEIVPRVNALQARFGVVVATQDWHPADHSSFAANHAQATPMSVIAMPYGPQVLWPTHCVQGTAGAAFHPSLHTNRCDLVVRKGYRTGIDSYSAFFENDHTTPTGLAGYLRERGVTDLVFVGLALDFCVRYSAVDAARMGFGATVRLDACRAIDLNGSLAEAEADMAAEGVTLAQS